MVKIVSSHCYSTEPAVDKLPLPDPLHAPGLPRVNSAVEWPAAATYWRETILNRLYGGMPPVPERVEVDLLCFATARRLCGEPTLLSYRVNCWVGSRRLSFTVRLFLPAGEGPFPAVVNGDGCWSYITDETIQMVLASGCALVSFNRTELVEDVGGVPFRTRERFLPKGQTPDPTANIRKGALYELFQSTDFGAISGWAWGYHRCIDLLEQLPFIDLSRIAVTGHSRGGKATLLAGLTDERITLINDNAACAAGAPLFRYVGSDGESLTIVKKFPTWFNPEMEAYFGREEAIPFDQHCFLAALAPRPVLLTYSVDDRWSNPEGMVLSVSAARKAYALFGVSDHLSFHLREGAHSHHKEDWDALVRFIQWKWFNLEAPAAFNRHPYSHLPEIHF